MLPQLHSNATSVIKWNGRAVSGKDVYSHIRIHTSYDVGSIASPETRGSLQLSRLAHRLSAGGARDVVTGYQHYSRHLSRHRTHNPHTHLHHPLPPFATHREDVGIHWVRHTIPHTPPRPPASQPLTKHHPSQIPHLAHLKVRHQVCRHPARNQQRVLHHRPRECHLLRHRRPRRQPCPRAARLGPDLRVHRLSR